MPEPGEFAISRPNTSEMARISMALHDLCQPLTTLQCRLELADLVGTPEACRDAVKGGLVECMRLSEAVSSMREAVRAAARHREMGVSR
jgi:hypothetical protein